MNENYIYVNYNKILNKCGSSLIEYLAGNDIRFKIVMGFEGSNDEESYGYDVGNLSLDNTFFDIIFNLKYFKWYYSPMDVRKTIVELNVINQENYIRMKDELTLLGYNIDKLPIHYYDLKIIGYDEHHGHSGIMINENDLNKLIKNN
jgi:hypothetical protein